MTIVTYSTVADNNQTLAPENTMVVSDLNNAIRQVAADVRGFGNQLCWYRYGSGVGELAPERVSGTSFRVAADLRSVYAVGKRVRAVGVATGDIQGTITSRSFSSPHTTVIVAWDSGSLVAEALTIYVSVVSAGMVPNLAGRPLVLSEDANTRLQDEGDRIGVHVEGTKIVEIAEERVNLFGYNDDAFVNPRLQLIRRKPTAHEPFDSLGSIDWFARDTSLGSDILHARMWARPITSTPGAVDGLIDWAVTVSGTLTRLLRLRPGALLLGKVFADNGATDGVEMQTSGDIYVRDIGARDATVRNVTASGTVAADTVAVTTSLTVDGDVAAVFKTSDPLEISGPTLTFALPPDFGQPSSISFKLRCVVAQHGYSVGDEVFAAFQTATAQDGGWTVWADETTVGLSIWNPRVNPKGGGAPVAITLSSWRVIFVVSK